MGANESYEVTPYQSTSDLGQPTSDQYADQENDNYYEDITYFN